MKLPLPALFLLAAILALASRADAQSYIDLKTGASFAVLGASTVTSTGNTILNGDLGLSPGTAITGFGPGVVNGTTYSGAGSLAAQAQTDALAAYNVLLGEAFTQDLTGHDLGGKTLLQGVYKFGAAAALTGTLTLNGLGDPNARFHFQIGSTLTTAGSSQVILINGAQASNVYWQVGSSGTFNSDSVFAGTVLAYASITAVTGTTVDGRLIALTGAVTLDTNTISVPTAVPEPSTYALFAALAAFGAAAWRRWPAAI